MDEQEPRGGQVGAKPGRRGGRGGAGGLPGGRGNAAGEGRGAGRSDVAAAGGAKRGRRAAAAAEAGEARGAGRAATAEAVRSKRVARAAAAAAAAAATGDAPKRGGGRGKAKRGRVGAVGAPARRRRMFDGGELRLVILKLIQDEPRRGYELIKAIEEMTGGNYAPSPGVIYPALSMLQEMDQIAAQDAEDGRRRFAITDAGKEQVGAAGEKVDGLIVRLTNFGTEQGKVEDAPVRSALGTLRAALQDKLSGGNLPDATLTEIATLIEETAQKITKMG